MTSNQILQQRLYNLTAIRVLLFGLLLMLCQNLYAAPKLPLLKEIDHIYALGTFDILDIQQDLDGLRDRPRLIIWPGNKMTKEKEGIDLETLQTWVIKMLGNSYITETHERWHHNYHRIADYNTGGIVYKDGTLVGWYLDKGGLGYLDFAYDPIHEKVSYWKPLSLKKPKASPETSRIYRVPDWGQLKKTK